MVIEIKKNADVTIMELVGRLDTTTAPSLEKTIGDAMGEMKNLVLDLKGLEYVSSAGLRVLLSAQKKIQAVGAMELINVQETVMDVLEITGFADILTIK